MNALQLLPFYDLDDREFSFVNSNWTMQLSELMESDFYNLLPNPDKNDEADPDSTTTTTTTIFIITPFSTIIVTYLEKLEV